MTWQGEYDKLFIGGKWVAPSTTQRIDVVSPYSEQLVASVPKAGRADADRAVGAARDAFDAGPWPRLSVAERIDTLTALARDMRDREDELAELVTTEMGCPITLSRTMQSRNARTLLESFLETAESYPWSEVRQSTTGRALVTREPLGVVTAIVPWNAPILSTLMKLAPALLAGCTLVWKPSSEAPLSAYLLADLLQSVGLPEGVLNLLPADREVGEYLVTHPGVDKVSFTGSTGAGRRIAALCGNDLRRVTLELGGKSAAVILEDADLDLVVESVKKLSLRNSGQVCSNKTRLVVPEALRPEITDRVASMLGGLAVGDPADPSTDIGPLVSERQRESVESYIEIGQDEGARLICGGARPPGLGSGWFVQPTLFADVAPSMKIAQEEIFGPVLALLSYATEDDAVDIANNSPYGLSGSVFSKDEERALRVARRIRTGTVEVNGSPVGWQAPVGGVKCSGIGREAGREGFEAYVDVKSYGLSEALAGQLAEAPLTV